MVLCSCPIGFVCSFLFPPDGLFSLKQGQRVTACLCARTTRTSQRSPWMRLLITVPLCHIHPALSCRSTHQTIAADDGADDGAMTTSSVAHGAHTHALTNNTSNYVFRDKTADLLFCMQTDSKRCISEVGSQYISKVGSQCISEVGAQCISEVGSQYISEVGSQYTNGLRLVPPLRNLLK